MLKRTYLYVELVFVVVCLPLLLWATANRIIMLSAMWGGGLITLIYLLRYHDWKQVWHGTPPDKAQQRLMVWRFVILTIATVFLTQILAPEKFFAFPVERTNLWLVVMVLYPVLSALPQEMIYRAFFFRRYVSIIPSQPIMITTSAIAFGLSHLMMNNWVAPMFCVFGGLLFGQSYTKHHSLKWTAIEHAVYGCMIFTVGLGWFFYIGNWR